MIDITMMKAISGDAIHIRVKVDDSKYFNILVDTGTKSCARKIEELLNDRSSANEFIDLLIITHTDRDHIGGISKLVEEERLNYKIIKEVWINDGEENNIDCDSLYTASDGRNLIDILKENKITVRTKITTNTELEIYGISVNVLSPTVLDLDSMKINWLNDIENDDFYASGDDELDLDNLNLEDQFVNDTNTYNNCSISFMLTIEGKQLLFLGDASSDYILRGLEESTKILAGKVDLIKIPHHGSRSNTSKELLNSFVTSNFLISTNGSHSKPHKRTLSRIINNSYGETIKLYCNYSWWTEQGKFTNNDIVKYLDSEKLKLVLLNDTYINLVDGVRIKNG